MFRNENNIKCVPSLRPRPVGPTIQLMTTI